MVYVFGLIGLIVVVLMASRMVGAGRPPYLGLRDGRLAACPASPNCVCSQSGDASHQIDPISFSGTTQEAIVAIKEAVALMPRMRVVTQADSQGYLHAEARSRLFGFVDDVEFWFDEPNQRIHVRSASRVGYSDLGVNRERVEVLRQKLTARP